jgi:hypothetical protein
MQALVGQRNAPGGDAVALVAALVYAARGWPVLPVEPGGKTPLTRHGVKDATTDPDRIRRWFRVFPDANVGIATGAPGPTVLDIDDLDAARSTIGGVAVDTPTVATPRGRHYWFAGEQRGTVGLGYGELRGQGSYVVAPPSIGADGRVYTWLVEPNSALPAAPGFIAGSARTAGCGQQKTSPRRIPHGERHPYLVDLAVRLARAGVTDERRLLAHVQLEFELACETVPTPAPGSLEGIARWAARSRIAQRERRSTA